METSTKVTNLKVDKLGQPTIKCEFSVTDIVKVINEVGVFIHDISTCMTLRRVVDADIMMCGFFRHFKESAVFSLHERSEVTHLGDQLDRHMDNRFIVIDGDWDDGVITMWVHIDRIELTYTRNRKNVFKMTVFSTDGITCNATMVVKCMISALKFSTYIQRFIGKVMHNYYMEHKTDGWRID